MIVLVMLAGCTPDICGRSSDCTTGKVCTANGACVIPADASVGDATTATVEDGSATPIRDAALGTFDALDEPAPDAAPDAAIDAATNTIDAPDDDGLAGAGREGAAR